MKKIMVLLMTLFVLYGCADGDRYNFSGSSEHWDVIYVIDASNQTEQIETGTIKYTGEDPVPKTIDYILEYQGGNASEIGIPLDEGVTNTEKRACNGCAAIQEDEEIEVEIMWNGQTENLILTIDK